MTTDFELLYKPAIHAAEKRFRSLQKSPPDQWIPVNSDTAVEVYSNLERNSSFKAVTEIKSSKKELEYWFSVLSTLYIRPNWCHFCNNPLLLSRPSSNISIIQGKIPQSSDNLFVEKITRKEGHVSYIATSFSQTNQKAKNYLLACDISIHFGVTRLTFFYQSEKNILNMNVPTILSSTVTDFINLELFAWISYCDKEIDIKNFVLKDKKLELCYGFSSNHKNNVTTQPLLIQPTSNLNIRRPRSGSWGIDLNAKSDSTLQKNKFPSTSILLSSSTPQVIPTSSYTEGQLDKCPSNEQRTNDTANEESEATESIITIEAQSQPSISIDLPDHKEWISKFAQLCVRLYQKSNGLYIIKMIHPSTLLEYLTNDNIQMEDNIIRVKMEIKESILGTCCVNENNWPITSWNPQTVTNPIDDPSTSETDDNDDIFVNQMEELGTESPIIKSQPIKSPTSLSLTPIENRQQQPQQQLMKELAKLPHVQKQPIKEINTSSTVPFVQKQVLKETSSSSLILEQKKQLPIKDKKVEKSKNKTLYETNVPDSEPVAIKDAHSQFVDFLQSKTPCATIQQPTKENGNVTITKLDVPNHPVGAFLSYSTWKNCSIWDAKAVLENVGSRKAWDPLFDDAQFLHPVSDTTSIWHTKIKGSWPLGAHDYVSFNGKYISDLRVDLCSVSCDGDSYQHNTLPKEKSGTLRATVNVQGYRLEQTNAETISIRQLILAQISNTWVPHYLCGRVFAEICSMIYQAKKYFESYGAPPNLEKLSHALLVGVKHDHNNKNWRCEYIRHDQKETSDAKTKICVRLDKRRWANSQNNRYSVVVDPPPSRIHAKEKACDPFGIWLTVEHDKAFIIPLRGNILVLIKPDTSMPGENSGCLTVNGSVITVEEEEQSLYLTDYPQQQDIIPQASPSTDGLKNELNLKDIKSVLDAIKVSPKEQAAAAFSFLKRTDEQFGWTVLTDNTKTGIRICKKSGIKSSGNNNNKDQTSSLTLDVPEPFMVYKISKVIENFSVDEVLSVVTDTDQIRKSYDDTIDNIELLSEVEPGCKVIKQNVKAVFPFKSREMYTCTCLAQETSSLAMQPTKRTFYIESSLPDYPSTKESKKVRGCLFISGWILEPVDPYTTTTNHPIVSTHVTYVAALDLGPSVPTYLSNLVANNWFPKKMIAIEKYLNTKGAPPFLTQPTLPLVFSNNKLTNEEKSNFQLKEINTKYEQQKRIYRVTNRWKVSELLNDNGDSSTKSNQTSSTVYINHNRRPSNPLSDPTYRRGSLPSTVLKRRVNPPSDRQVLSLICLNLTIDTCTFPGGYDITCYLSDMAEKKKDVTGKLNVLISQIPVSNLVNTSETKKACKHSIIVCAYLSPSESDLDFEFELAPAKEDNTNKSATQLTVQGVLGQEDQNKWKGKMTVNGDVVELEEEIQLKYANERDETDIDHEAPSRVETPANDSDNSADEEVTSNGIQYIGGGVVATALGNVSTSVNNLGARIMHPFRSSSSGVLVSPNQTKNDSLEGQIFDENTSENESSEKEENIPKSLLQRKAQQLREKMDSHQKEILLMYICCGLSVIVALLLLQFMLERYYTSFAATREIYGPEDAVAYRLINVPWFRGWKVQLIAIKSNNL